MAMLDSLLERSVVGSFTTIGYKTRSRGWEAIPGDAMTGKVVLITGATSGIGKQVAHELASRGARLRFVARNEEKALALRDDLIGAAGHDDIRYYIADLSLMSQVAAASDSILQADKAIDVLINNAVVLPAERTVTAEGLELSHATNLVAPFLLTTRLMDRIVESAPARIINVISGGMYTQGMALEDLNSSEGEYKGAVAYARAKRRLMVLTKMWAEQLDGTGVTVNATHPGWVDTPGIESSLPTFHKLTKPFLRSVEQGSDTIVWLAAGDPGGETSGKLWHDRAIRSEYKMKSTIETSAERNELLRVLNETVADLTPAS